MSELDISIRYGFVEQEKAGELTEITDKVKSGQSSGPKDLEDIELRIFEEGEDTQWSSGVIMAKRRPFSRHLPARRRSLPIQLSDREMKQMAKTVQQARHEGKIPFRVVGSKKAVPEFLQQVSAVKLELIA